MLKAVRVPKAFEAPFQRAEAFVEGIFGDIQRRPEAGTLHIGGERYVMMRAESLYLTWFDALKDSFGEEAAREFIYNTAREIGKSDSSSFSARLKLDDGLDRLSSGPVHFAHAGWALVEILEDSRPTTDENYFLHYFHPNTFESEVVVRRGRKLEKCGCFFSAGYSAGWCSDAFRLEVHGRELRCVGKGDTACEFIMSPDTRLDEHEQRVRASWTA
jgi:predicted hydrocarbon binding protein